MNSRLVLYVAAYVVILLVYISNASVYVHMNSRSVSVDKPALKYLQFCVDCAHPNKEGSVIKALVAKHGIQDFDVSGELIYCFPNHGETLTILNRKEFSNKIVMVDRGKVSMLRKIEHILGVRRMFFVVCH